jgi:hypothetical protein
VGDGSYEASLSFEATEVAVTELLVTEEMAVAKLLSQYEEMAVAELLVD